MKRYDLISDMVQLDDGDFVKFEDTQALSEKYYELLYAVESKFPDETRHETALRYIRSSENSMSDAEGPGIGGGE